MKSYFDIPTDEEFYVRYATLVPTLNKLGYLAQIVSALTEFGIIYALIFDSVDDFWPDYAPTVATVGAVVGTAFIEIGLRQFTPYSARAILYRRFSGLDAWMSGFVLAACIGLLGASGALSFFGSKQVVAAIAPEPTEQTTAAADSVATAAEQRLLAIWRADSTAIADNFATQLAATEAATAAQVQREQAAIRTLRRRERAEERSYATRRTEAAERIAAARASGAAAIAQLEAARADQLTKARQTFRTALDDNQSTLTAAKAEVATANAAERSRIDNQVRKYGGGLAYFTVLCLVVFVLSISLREIHRAGAGMAERIEPDAYTFEAPPWAAFLAALGGRINRRVYGIIHAIEKNTREAPEPVAPPTVWVRSRQNIPQQSTHYGVPRRSAAARSGGLFSLRKKRAAAAPEPTSAASTAAVASGCAAPAAGATSAAAESDKQRLQLEANILAHLRTAIRLESKNEHESARTFYLKADDVLRAYLGPKATPETIAALRQACIEFLNENGPNPFAQHHERRSIGFERSTPAAEKEPAATAPLTTVVNEAPAEERERVVYVDKNSKPCAHCSTLFLPKNYRHKYCSTDCRLADHANRHGGKAYDPNYKPWKT